MTDGTLDIAAIADLLGRFTPQPRCELLCGPDVIMWLRVLTPEEGPSFPWSQTPPFTGIPVIPSPDLGRGEWELRENGEVTACGRFNLPEPPDFTSLMPPIALDRLPPRAYPFALGSVI